MQEWKQIQMKQKKLLNNEMKQQSMLDKRGMLQKKTRISWMKLEYRGDNASTTKWMKRKWKIKKIKWSQEENETSRMRQYKYGTTTDARKYCQWNKELSKTRQEECKKHTQKVQRAWKTWQTECDKLREMTSMSGIIHMSYCSCCLERVNQNQIRVRRNIQSQSDSHMKVTRWPIKNKQGQCHQ